MKIKNKLLIILILFIGLFLISGNNTFATVDVPISTGNDNFTFTLPDIPSEYGSNYFVFVGINSDGKWGAYVCVCNYDDFYYCIQDGSEKYIWLSDAHYSYYFYTLNPYNGNVLITDCSSMSWTYYQKFTAFSGRFSYFTGYGSKDILNYYDHSEVVFREAGGSSGGNGLQNPYGEYNYSSEDTSGGEYVDSDFEDTSDGGWLSKLTNWLKAPFQKLAQLLAKIFNFFVNFIQRILAGFFDFFVTVFVPDTDDIIFDDVKETLLNKFPFIDSFRQIQNDFVNAFDNETGCPTFTITLPAFLGGSTVSPIDFRFYNQYRGWINGFIIASSYFLFIRKMYYKIPSMIRGE